MSYYLYNTFEGQRQGLSIDEKRRVLQRRRIIEQIKRLTESQRLLEDCKNQNDQNGRRTAENTACVCFMINNIEFGFL